MVLDKAQNFVAALDKKDVTMYISSCCYETGLI